MRIKMIIKGNNNRLKSKNLYQIWARLHDLLHLVACMPAGDPAQHAQQLYEGALQQDAVLKLDVQPDAVLQDVRRLLVHDLQVSRRGDAQIYSKWL